MPISEEERLRRRVAYRMRLLKEAAVLFSSPLVVHLPDNTVLAPYTLVPVGSEPVILRSRLPRHPVPTGCRARLHLPVTVEGLLYLDGKLFAGLDPHHGEWRLVELTGQEMTVVFDHGPTRTGRVSVENWEVLIEEVDTVSLADDLDALLSTAEATDPLLREHLLRTADEVISQLDQAETVEEMRKLAPLLAHDLWQHLAPYRGLRLGAVFAAAYSHLDAAWLWTFAETRIKFRRTMANAVQYLRAFPEAIFHLTQAWCLEQLRHDDPQLFAEVSTFINAGRIRLVGGMWVESDVHLASGETILRQLILGQRYFLQHFGRFSRVGWLPDSFGFAGSLPQLFRAGGLYAFVTPKLNLNETNLLPHNVFRWIGVDGSDILAVHYRNPHHNYDGQMEAKELIDTYRVFEDARNLPEALLTFGYGDGGGGPTLAMGERLRRFEQLGGLPQVRQGAIDTYLADLQARHPKLAEWRGELYFELTRGTYSSQARLKANQVAAERALLSAEMAASSAALAGLRPYPREALQQLWEQHALFHFHDVLAGTVPPVVYREVLNAWERVKDEAERLFHEALSGYAGPLLFSAHSAPHAQVIALPKDHPWLDAYPHNVQADDQVAWFGPVELPALGATAQPKIRTISPVHVVNQNDRLLMDNAWITAVIGPDGELEHLWLKSRQRDMLANSTRVSLYPDRPMRSDAAMQAWDVDRESLAQELKSPQWVSQRILAAGPLVARVQVHHRTSRSYLTRVYHLDAAEPFLRIEWEIQWHESERWLKWWWPFAINADRATTGIPYGIETRPTHPSTPWDAAKFEVYAHKFVDLSEGDVGVAILHQDRYGYALRHNEVGVTLLRSPTSPDPEADQGAHQFHLAVYPHEHAYTESDVAGKAEAFAVPPRLAWGLGTAEFGAEWFSWQGDMGFVSAIKASEDGTGYVVRVVELTNRRGYGTLLVPRQIHRVIRTNALEGLDPEDVPVELSIVDQRVTVPLRPLEVVTLVALP